MYRAHKLTTFMCQIFLKFYKPQPPGALRACSGLYRDSYGDKRTSYLKTPRMKWSTSNPTTQHRLQPKLNMCGIRILAPKYLDGFDVAKSL